MENGKELLIWHPGASGCSVGATAPPGRLVPQLHGQVRETGGVFVGRLAQFSSVFVASPGHQSNSWDVHCSPGAPLFSAAEDGMKFSESHEWALADGKSATVGISEHAQVGAGGIAAWGQRPRVADRSAFRGGRG